MPTLATARRSGQLTASEATAIVSDLLTLQDRDAELAAEVVAAFSPTMDVLDDAVTDGITTLGSMTAARIACLRDGLASRLAEVA